MACWSAWSMAAALRGRGRGRARARARASHGQQLVMGHGRVQGIMARWRVALNVRRPSASTPPRPALARARARASRLAPRSSLPVCLPGESSSRSLALFNQPTRRPDACVSCAHSFFASKAEDHSIVGYAPSDPSNREQYPGRHERHGGEDA